jgi:uncharacterized protein (TIGR00251 family)
MTSAPPDAAVLRLRVQPRASRQAVLGWRDGVLRVAVTASPVDGAANEAVRRLLASAVAVAPSAVTVVRGERGRDKIVRIGGVTEAEARARLAASVRDRKEAR